MMKSYIDLIKQFWIINRQERFTPSAYALYFYLLEECNRNFWKMPIFCPTSVVLSIVGLNNTAVSRARLELSNRGLIRFVAGKRSHQAPSYIIISDVETSVTNDNENVEANADTNRDTNIETKHESNTDTYIKDKDKTILDSKSNKEVQSVEVLRDSFLHNNIWKQEVKGLLAKKENELNDAQLNDYINQFFQYLNSIGQKQREPMDCRKHCINWIRIQIQNNKNSIINDTAKQRIADRRGGLKVGTGSAKDYEAPF